MCNTKCFADGPSSDTTHENVYNKIKWKKHQTLYTLFKNSWLYMCWFVCLTNKRKKKNQNQKNLSIFNVETTIRKKIKKTKNFKVLTVLTEYYCASIWGIASEWWWRHVERCRKVDNDEETFQCCFNGKLANVLTFFSSVLFHWHCHRMLAEANVNCIVMIYLALYQNDITIMYH